MKNVNILGVQGFIAQQCGFSLILDDFGYGPLDYFLEMNKGYVEECDECLVDSARYLVSALRFIVSFLNH
jgi:hypothetical protein